MLPFVDNLMPFRYQHLQWTLKGLEMTGVPLIEYDGTKFLPAGISDDTGIYFFIPQIAKLLNVSLDWAIFIFFSSIFITSLFLSFFLLFKLFPHKNQKAITTYFILIIFLFCFFRGDIYIFTAISVSTLIPLFLYINTNYSNKIIFYILLFVLGFILSIFNFIRSNSATAILLFCLYLIIINKNSKFLLKVSNILCIFTGYLLFLVFLNLNIYNERNNFLYNHKIEIKSFPEGHIFWHQVYIGLGFLTNNFGIKYTDDSALNKAKEIDPDVIPQSITYEKILKNEVFRIITNDPWFFIKNIFAKLGVIFLYLLIFSNFGLIFIFKNQIDFHSKIAFTLVFIFNLIFPLLAVPYPSYVLGTVATLNIFVIYTLNNYLNKKNLKLNDLFTFQTKKIIQNERL